MQTRALPRIALLALAFSMLPAKSFAESWTAAERVTFITSEKEWEEMLSAVVLKVGTQPVPVARRIDAIRDEIWARVAARHKAYQQQQVDHTLSKAETKAHLAESAKALVMDNLLSWYESQLLRYGGTEQLEAEATKVRLASLRDRQTVVNLVEHPNVLNESWENLKLVAEKLQLPRPERLLFPAGDKP